MPSKKQQVLELDDEPKVKQEPGMELQQQQPAREAQGVVGVDGMVEALVVSNSRLCAQVDAFDARAFKKLERARVLELQLNEVKAEHKASLSVLKAESKTKEVELKARVAILEAHDSRLREQITSMQQQQQQQQ